MPTRYSGVATALLLLFAQLVAMASAKGKSAQTIEKTFEPGQGGVTERTGARSGSVRILLSASSSPPLCSSLCMHVGLQSRYGRTPSMLVS